MSVLARSLLLAPTALAGCMGLSPSVTLGLQRSFSAAPAVDTSSAKVPVMPPFSYKPAPYKGPSAEEVMRLRKAHLSPCECLSLADLPPALKAWPIALTKPLFHVCSAVPALQEAHHDCGGQDAVPV